jgi:sulfite dehydrogenase
MVGKPLEFEAAIRVRNRLALRLMRDGSELGGFGRRAFLRMAAAGALIGGGRVFGVENARVILPFENGERELVRYPQKRPLIRLTTRPPQLETPFEVFNEGIFTPNDAFFVRYHLPNLPLEVDPEAYRLQVGGSVERSLSLSLKDLREGFEGVEVAAVNQCSGNGRGFFQPRVPGGQLGNGAMGNALWRGVRLKDVLERAGVRAGARQVSFNGMDTPVSEKTPDFVKAVDVDQALDGEIVLAFEMNGEPLPMLNGYPVRLVVPGHYGTYWVKHLHEVTVLDEPFPGFWMSTAYRIPDTVGACVEPGGVPKSTVPIRRFNVRSFITSHRDGAVLRPRVACLLRGIAFDGGAGIREVLVSVDGGRTWQAAQLGRDHGRYSFREWTLAYTPLQPGAVEFKVKATNRLGESQPAEALWNPAGYMRNVVETVRARVEA